MPKGLGYNVSPRKAMAMGKKPTMKKAAKRKGATKKRATKKAASKHNPY